MKVGRILKILSIQIQHPNKFEKSYKAVLDCLRKVLIKHTECTLHYTVQTPWCAFMRGQAYKLRVGASLE